jgi:hypothetical protein
LFFNFEKKQKIQNLLIHITLFTEILPLIFCILFYKQYESKESRVFFIYTIVIAITSLLSSLSLVLFKQTHNYQIIVKLFAFSEFIILSYYYKLLIKRKSSNIIFVLAFVFFCFLIYKNWLTRENSQITFPLLFEFIFFIIILLYYYFLRISTISNKPIYEEIEFWQTTAFFIYFSGNFFFLIFVSYNNVQLPQINMQFAYSTITFLKNLIISIGFILFAKNRKKDETTIEHFDSFNHITPTNT